MGSNVILIRKTLVEISGLRRSIGVFRCPGCLVEFETRMERAKVMTGLCIPCANKAAGRKRATHGLNNSNSRLHVTWANMKRRCLKPRGSEVQKYQGVTLCEEWMSFEPFMAWSLANGYSDRLTLDRIESSKGYEPGNCRYADYNVQAANRRLTDKNTSGHVGINWSRGKWAAKVQWKKKQIHLGRFKDKKDAIKARNDYLAANDLPHLRA
ncbi:hypothetical protein HBO37_28540 [Pseudomonas proteolytica]|uniref:hypothetical protein n=1 Tax=Pseudomonas proteolytica TaxID=219574 RepID=UPI00147422D5|nr:hypothetical protein [Pseudomonas proteolytica]NMZ09289.1 hypothetical protein [Pseudomonas proteolytica]